MCCFSRAVRSVSGTQIFARALAGDRQALVYAMRVALDEPLAMVLPLPVVPGSGDEAVRFVDLSGYPKFFEDVERAFPARERTASFGLQAARANAPAKLVVHAVGDFVASYVPSPADFTRLDERFRMPPNVFASHAELADYGFAVFQLAPHALTPAPPKRWFEFWRSSPGGDAAAPEQGVHPMALVFPSRRPRALYFPTLHVHDGAKVPARATYDHALFCQSSDPVLTKTMAWRATDDRLGAFVDAKRAHGLVDEAQLAYRSSIIGEVANRDHWFEPPACRAESLAIRGTHFTCDLAALSAYEHDDSDRKTTARTRLDELSAGLARELAALVATHGEAWSLIELAGTSPPDAWLSNWEPHVFKVGPEKLAPGTPGPFTIQVPSESPRVETQNVCFRFARAPSRDDILAIRKAMSAAFERALS